MITILKGGVCAVNGIYREKLRVSSQLNQASQKGMQFH